MSLSDDDLIALVRTGDRSALAEFVERRRPQLLAFIEKNLSDSLRRKIDAQDIVQELSISALGSAESIELGDRDPFSWLCQLAERRIIDAHRRFFGAQKRSAGKEVGLEAPAGNAEKGGLIDLLSASLTSASKAFSKGQREFLMLQAFEQLSEEGRLALRLRYVNGLPSKEIAEQLGRSDGAVRVLLTRTLQKLRDILSQHPDFESFRT